MTIATESLLPAYSAAIASRRRSTGGAELLLDIFGIIGRLAFYFHLYYSRRVEGVELLGFSLGHECCLREARHIFEWLEDLTHHKHVDARGCIAHLIHSTKRSLESVELFN